MTHYIPTRRSSDLFELYGQQFVGLNGGPTFKFSEAISFMISCDDQAEVDYYWEKLTEGGQEQPCGWLKDKFGVSWQVTPKGMEKMLDGTEKGNKTMAAMLKMRKQDLAEMERAYNEGRGKNKVVKEGHQNEKKKK